MITVFLADDHTMMRDGLRHILEAEADMKVVGEAADGLAALEEVTRLRPDVVIMDIRMPELGGIEATWQIRTACPSAQVVILSMHASAQYIYRALQAGALGYVLKESAGSELIKAVRAAHRGERHLSRKISNELIEEYLRRGNKEVDDPLAPLSARERQVLQLVVRGNTNAKIAELLHLSPKSVATYRSRMMMKLGISDLPSLVKFAMQHGLLLDP
ncbi:response regulator transcription factor [Litorilinea aerophila]|uniref:Response regulator transcription factor n=1 Tax=Litorilinea aerophila TaxID=1204385 RepID=A0A540VBN3_9CHLR|nr:response regulator transcription factor [Litorilinea aerophila]MCC9078645.1 response regulator transcription factor [Litorilinea aerophila]OUC09266.1 hypothetical protein RY27_03880 [Litorilinea aerophila]GIV77428.1 MAG: DNA-binding response regulator [Litorilinea sp.]